MGVKVTKDNVGELLDALAALRTREVLVGIPEASALREPEPGEKGQPASNALIGYVMETGLPEKNIPARPFLVPGVESVKDAIVQRMKKGAAAVLDGDVKAAGRTLDAVGLIAVDAVQQKITDGPFVPLAPRTLAAREARGRTGTKPLLDTGQLRNAIILISARSIREPSRYAVRTRNGFERGARRWSGLGTTKPTKPALTL